MIGRIVLLAVFLKVLGIVHSLPTFPDGSEENTVWQIPQKDGSFRSMTKLEALEEALAYEYKENEPKKRGKVKFYLYTAENPTSPIEIDKDDPKSLLQSTFNSQNPTRFMIHGWNGRYNLVENRLIREALLLKGSNRQFNFISVDWSVYAESVLYVPSQQSCSKTGKIVAKFIDWMHDNAKLSFDTLAVYGHSLGAHVAGFTGKNVKRGKIHTIIGLDPALPLFNYNNPKKRLAETDAVYVETIHTNGGGAGFYQPIGRASFYPNGGKRQPGCGLDLGCSHGRSVEYLAEALALEESNGFVASKCQNFKDIKNSGSSCEKSKEDVRLGQPSNDRFAKGIYYLKTDKNSPFGLGNSS